MKPRKICYVVHQFLPRYFTGTEQYVYAIAREMSQRGHDVEVFSLEPDFGDTRDFYEETEEEVEGLRVFRIRFWMLLQRDWKRMEYRHPFVGSRFASYLERTRPDLVHFFHLRYLGAHLIGEARSLGIPTAVHLMDFWFVCPAVVLTHRDGTLCDGPPEGGMGCIPCIEPELDGEIERRGTREQIRQLHRHAPATSVPGHSPAQRAATLLDRPAYLRRQLLLANRIFAPSEFLRAVFANNGVPEARVDILRYGVDTSRLTPRTARPADTPLRLGFIGSISEHKGTDVCIDAVLATAGALELTIHGRTTDFPEFAEPLVERAKADPRIEFAGPFPRDRLGAVLSAMDVLLAPSRWYENTPFVVLEAFAAGIPVIASDLGGIAEIVHDEENGELFPRGDATELAARLARLLREPERIERYRAQLPATKTMTENGDELESTYAELTDGASA